MVDLKQSITDEIARAEKRLASRKRGVREAEAELTRLHAARRALHPVVAPEADGRAASTGRGLALLKWALEQPLGSVITPRMLQDELGYTRSGATATLSYHRFIRFHRTGIGRYLYEGLTGRVPRRNGELRDLICASLRVPPHHRYAGEPE